MGYADIILDCLHNRYIIQATVNYFFKIVDLPICIMYLLWITQSKLCISANYVRIMYSTTH
jgi:hypothetical protein